MSSCGYDDCDIAEKRINNQGFYSLIFKSKNLLEIIP